MNDLICKAISNRLLLGFNYKGTSRWVEPHAYGCKQNGGNGLCAWQLAGGSGQAFRLFLESKMTAVETGDPFQGSRPGYHRGDRQFTKIFAEL